MSEAPARSIWATLERIPRWAIYLILALVVLWQLLWPKKLPIVASLPTEGVYRAIQAVPDDKIVLLSADWDASTEAETGPQTVAILHAIFQAKKRLAIINIGVPPGVKLAQDRAKAVAKLYGARYGTDWINWGYKYGGGNIIIGMTKNIPTTIKTDVDGTSVTDYAKLPIMRGVQTTRDVGLVIEVSGAAVTEYWLQFLQGTEGTPTANAVTAVMAPGYYPYLDSGQLRGMLVGAKGAAEMEQLVRRPGRATPIMNVQSWAHLLILIFIVVGNLGYLAARRSRKGGAA